MKILNLIKFYRETDFTSLIIYKVKLKNVVFYLTYW